MKRLAADLKGRLRTTSWAIVTAVGTASLVQLAAPQTSMLGAIIIGSLFLLAQTLLIGPVLLREDVFANPQMQTRMREEAERGRRLAIYDQQSGVLSLWYFDLRLLEECRRSQRYGLSMVLIILQATSVLGNDFEAMRARANATRAITQSVGTSDLVGAMGPMEFGICLLHCDTAGAASVLRQIFASLDEDLNWRVGLASFPDDGEEAQDLLDKAIVRSAPWRVASDSRAAA